MKDNFFFDDDFGFLNRENSNCCSDGCHEHGHCHNECCCQNDPCQNDCDDSCNDWEDGSGCDCDCHCDDMDCGCNDNDCGCDDDCNHECVCEIVCDCSCSHDSCRPGCNDATQDEPQEIVMKMRRIQILTGMSSRRAIHAVNVVVKARKIANVAVN